MFTSASLTFHQVEMALCFFVSGQFLSEDDAVSAAHDYCGAGTWHFRIMQPVMFALPFWLRFVQCLHLVWRNRAHGDFRRTQHVINAGKYFSAIMVVVTSAIHLHVDGDDLDAWTPWRLVWLATLLVKTLYCYAWDLKMDWDLLQWRQVPTAAPDAASINSGERLARSDVSFPPLLRRARVYSTPVYYFAMCSNLVARFFWSISLSVGQTLLPHNWSNGAALVEILRRFQWLVIRVENKNWERLRGGAADE